MDELLSEKDGNELDGEPSWYDRIVITSSLHPFCYAQGMTRYLYQHGLRIFEHAQFAEPLREHLHENAEMLSQANGMKIEFIRKMDFRKENRIQQIFRRPVARSPRKESRSLLVCIGRTVASGSGIASPSPSSVKVDHHMNGLFTKAFLPLPIRNHPSRANSQSDLSHAAYIMYTSISFDPH